MTTEQDIVSFTNFALEKVGVGAGELTIDELFDAWRIEHPLSEEYAENVAAVRASIEDFKAGERGRPAGETSLRLRQSLGNS
jgi:hypothetical protein